MSSFNEIDHPRGHVSNRGAFSEKKHTAPVNLAFDEDEDVDVYDYGMITKFFNRPDGSSIVQYEDGTVEYRNAMGLRHREDGPALIHGSGEPRFYFEGRLIDENELHRYVSGNPVPAFFPVNFHRPF